MKSPQLTVEELTNRQASFQQVLEKRQLEGAVIFRPQRIQYLTNFVHLSTERPIALVLPVQGSPAMLVPKLEEEHLQLQAPWLDDVRVYDEYPGRRHPMQHLADLINGMELGKKSIGVDNDGFLDQNSYQGPLLSTVIDSEIRSGIGIEIDSLRMIKTPVEIALLKESGLWASETHKLLQNEICAGKSEREISRVAEEKAYLKLDASHGREGHFGAVGLHASFRSGNRTSMGHAAMGSRLVKEGDNLVSYCQGMVSGYITELERTMFMGEPAEDKRELFSIVREAQQIAFDMLKPGIECATIDLRVRDFFERNCKTELTTHHQGHGLGLEFHEAPFLDLGDHTILETGMVISVEPGLYVKGLGGFRHSDTVAITSDRYEVLTPYASSIEDLIIS